jgi:hypothetical protein
VVASEATPEDYPALYAEHRVPLVLVGDAVLACSCATPRRLAGDTEDRNLGGDTEDRNLGGDTEGRNLGGDTEDRNLGGDTEGRRLGGDTEDRNLGGDTEGRRLGGDTEGRNLGGDTERMQCEVAPSCQGFRVRGARDVRFFDGQRVRSGAGGCVVE